MKGIKNIGLDYSSLIKLLPMGLGVNVFANAFNQTSLHDLHYIIAFLLMFIVVSLDSIIEYGRFDYAKLPKSLGVISTINGVVLIFFIVFISFFSNKELRDYSLPLLFISLSISSFLEFNFTFILSRALKNSTIDNASTPEYNIKDMHAYCVSEICFFLFYTSLCIMAAIKVNIIDFIPWIGLVGLLAEIYLFNYFKSPETNK